MNHLKEQVLRVARLEEVVERYLLLGRTGSSRYTLTGLCPFHADRHPSLRVRVDKQYYKCFACGEGGDVFRFVQQIEGIGFHEALVKLAGWYGLSTRLSGGSLPLLTQPVRKKEQELKPISALSAVAVAYLLREHGVMLANLKEYTPADPVLTDTYRTFEVGLAPDSLPAAYHCFCRRLIFPIRNEVGQLVAFAGRYLGEPDKEIAKYVNSPTSAVYQKDHLLYGLYQAKEAILQHHFVYITEGYKDVLAMHAAGFQQTVALAGTALTVHHAALLKRYTRRVVLVLDGDCAGQEASRKAGQILTQSGLSVSYLTLAPGEDPDSLLRSQGKETFVQSIRQLTTICRLETYEIELIDHMKIIYDDLAIALSTEDHFRLLHELKPLCRRLGKVTVRLRRNPVVRIGF